MADTTTNVKIRADARDVRAAGKAIRDAFSPMNIRQFRTAVGDTEKELKRVVGQQLALVKALKGVEAGSKAYKNLTRDLKSSREQAQALKGTIDSLRTAYGEFDKASSASARKRQSFTAGFAQGTGLSQYIPTGPGMGRRIAGTAAGGMARRLVGGAAAPFLTPGMGGLSTMLGSIPLLGGFASGALQAGQGMFQQAVAFHRSKLENLYWAGGPSPFERGDRLAGGVRGGAVSNQGVVRAQAELARRQQEQKWNTRIQRAVSSWGTRGEGADPEADRAARDLLAKSETPEAKRVRGAIRSANAERLLSSMNKMPGAHAQAIGGGGFGAASNLPGQLKRVLNQQTLASEEAIATARDKVQEAKDNLLAAGASSRWKAFQQAAGGLGTGAKMMSPGFGAKYGFAPEQSQQMLGQFMGARGGVSTENAQRQADVSMAANLAFGVSMQTSGKFAKMGGFGQGAGLAGVLKAAVEQGLKGSQVPEYLDALVGMGEESRSQGMKVRDIGHMMNSATQSTAILGALGVEKYQRQNMVAGLGRSAEGLAAKGVQSPSDLLMLRAAGFDPRGGAMSYIRAIKKLEGGMNPDMMVNLLQLTAQGAQDVRVTGAKGPEDLRTARAMHMSRMLGSRGVAMKIGGAEDILKAMEGKSPEEFREFLKGFGERYGGGTAEERPTAEAALKTGAAGLARRGAPLAVTSAQLSVAQIGAGAKLAGVFIGLEKVGIQSVGVLGQFNKQLETVVKWMSGFVGVLDQFAAGKVSWMDIMLGKVKPKAAGGGKVVARGGR